MDKFSFFIMNVFVNSLLAFLTCVVLIEGIICLFRVRPGRVAAYLRMVPLVKLVLDLFFYNFQRWSFAHHVNPLTCPEGSRNLSAFVGYHFFSSGIQMTAPGELTFTVADILGYILPSLFTWAFAVAVVLMTILILFTRISRYCAAYKRLKTGVPNAACTLGFFSSKIAIPEGLFSKKEYNAVLAHEYGHVRHKDNLTRFILMMISSLFWWVPTKWLRKRIEAEQEIGCDLRSIKYGIDPMDLAQAMLKTAKQNLVVSCFSRNLLKKRITLLLHKPNNTHWILAAFAAGVAFFIVLLGRYWIF